ncbi:hypothetical protein N2W54_001890 [Lotmaria passim]
MRYRQSNQQYRSRDQQARQLINSNDVLSTREQEEVIAYFAHSLRTSTQFLKVVVCLHVLLALVYLFLLLSGSLLFDLEVDQTTTAKLLEVARQQRQVNTVVKKPVASIAASITEAIANPTTSPGGDARATQDPLAILAALDVQQHAANRKYAEAYLQRRSGSFASRLLTATNVVSVVVMLYSVGLLLWAAWSGYAACRLLRVNVEDLTSTEPRELGSRPANSSLQANGAAGTPEAKSTRGEVLQRLWRRVGTDPPAAQYLIAGLAAVASCFWLAVLLGRQWAMQRAYAEAGLPLPSVFVPGKVTDALLEYVLAVWQPLFHFAIGHLLRSMLDTKENLVTLSKLKYRFDKV